MCWWLNPNLVFKTEDALVRRVLLSKPPHFLRGVVEVSLRLAATAHASRGTLKLSLLAKIIGTFRAVSTVVQGHLVILSTVGNSISVPLLPWAVAARRRDTVRAKPTQSELVLMLPRIPGLAEASDMSANNTHVLSSRPAATAHASEFSCSNWLLKKRHKVMNDYSNSSSYGVR